MLVYEARHIIHAADEEDIQELRRIMLLKLGCRDGFGHFMLEGVRAQGIVGFGDLESGEEWGGGGGGAACN